MFVILKSQQQELTIVPENDCLDCIEIGGWTELHKGNKQECEKYIEELGYTGPIWNNCNNKENEIQNK